MSIGDPELGPDPEPPKRSPFHRTYVRAAGAVAYVAVVNGQGDEGIGSAFHIGDGVFVTARHVVEGVTIREVATTKSAQLADEAAGRPSPPRLLRVIDGPHFGADDLDAAVFRVELDGMPLPRIAVSPHTEYELEEHDFVLSDVLILGYPPIPYTTIPHQVVTLGQVNAVVRVRHSSASHFIASSMARGGFSGGVALDRSGVALALVTESLGTGAGQVETGYMSLLSITPAVDLAAARYGFSLGGGGPGRYSDTLIGFRLSRPSTTALSSYIYDATVYVYDDDRDVFAEFACDDLNLLEEAVAAFSAVVPLNPDRYEEHTHKWLLTPSGNPPAAQLATAAEAARSHLLTAGYVELASERSQWQFRGHAPS